MVNDYPKKEIEWKPVLNKDGGQVTSKDGTGIVTSDALLLTPQLQGQYGGWTFKDTATQEDIDGFPYIYELYFCDACDISIDPREMGEMYG